jgi:pyruvate dehydrogenase kinase 2/3/4
MLLLGRRPSQGRLLQASEFLRLELPVRLAHRVVELDSLPQNLNTMPSILRVRQWYVDSFQDLVNLPKVQYPKKIRMPPPNSKAVFYLNTELKSDELPRNPEQINANFVDTIEKIKKRHDPVAVAIGLALFFSSRANMLDSMKICYCHSSGNQ